MSCGGREIALKLGLHYNTVGAVLKRPEVQARVAQLQADLAAPLPDVEDIQAGMNQAARDALRALWQIVRHSRNETLRYKATVEILDRASPDVCPKRQLHGDTVLSSVLVDYESVDLYRRLNQKRQELAGAGQTVRMTHIPDGAVALANYYDRESRAFLGVQWVDAKGKPSERADAWRPKRPKGRLHDVQGWGKATPRLHWKAEVAAPLTRVKKP